MRYRVKELDWKGRPIRMLHPDLGRLYGGECVEIPEYVAKRYEGLLLERVVDRPKRARLRKVREVERESDG